LRTPTRTCRAPLAARDRSRRFLAEPISLVPIGSGTCGPGMPVIELRQARLQGFSHCKEPVSLGRGLDRLRGPWPSWASTSSGLARPRAGYGLSFDRPSPLELSQLLSTPGISPRCGSAAGSPGFLSRGAWTRLTGRHAGPHEVSHLLTPPRGSTSPTASGCRRWFPPFLSIRRFTDFPSSRPGLRRRNPSWPSSRRSDAAWLLAPRARASR